MMMAIRVICLFFVISATVAYQSELTDCPKDLAAKHLVGNETLIIAGRVLTETIRFVRLPKIGMYDKVLNCLEVIDLSGTNTSGTVELVEGGRNQRFAEFKFKSKFGGALNYIIQVYTD